MAPPIDRLIETLTETRAKLEEELGRVEAYRALTQLEQREASGERLSIVPGDRLREKLEAELAGNHFLNVRRKLDEALALLRTWDADERAADVAAPAAPAEETTPVPLAAVSSTSVEAPQAAARTRDIAMPPDDLSLISDLPSTCISVVAAAGYGRYRSLADIDAKGVAMLERLLGQPGIVARGNWIEQAAVLAAGSETRYAARLIAHRTGTVWPPAPHEPDPRPRGERPASDATPAMARPVADVVAPEVTINQPPLPDPQFAEPHDLTHVAGIDAATAQRLSASGITSFGALAAWTAQDVHAIAKTLALDSSRIAAEGWIEQAAMLAASRPTRHLDAKPFLVPLVALPPELAIPLDLDELVAQAAAADVPLELGQDLSAPEPILVDIPANDDPPPVPASSPADAPSSSPFWAAASGKTAVLRPLRRPSERADKAFDDVAALVARTVATARNVGGMSERPKRQTPSPARPGPDKPKADVPFRSAATAKATPEPPRQQAAVDVAARPLAPPSAPPIPAAVVSSPATLPVIERRPSVHPAFPPGNTLATVGIDPEATIEIRPRIAAAPMEKIVPRARAIDEPAKVVPNGTLAPATGSGSEVLRRSPGTPRVPLATSALRPAAGGQARPTIVIDELSGSQRAPSGLAASGQDLPPGRLGGLVGRFVKALRGDKAG